MNKRRKEEKIRQNLSEKFESLPEQVLTSKDGSGDCIPNSMDLNLFKILQVHLGEVDVEVGWLGGGNLDLTRTKISKSKN